MTRLMEQDIMRKDGLAYEMNLVIQGMIDGCAYCAGDPVVAAICNDYTASIDQYISDRINDGLPSYYVSLLTFNSVPV